mgnify:CR=1 FL=1
MNESTEHLDYRFDDRVAKQYDALRGHPPEVSPHIGVALANLFGSGARVLEPGVGTGRIALPLIAEGCEVVGVDLSAQMLGALKDCKQPNLHLVHGDITQLPFRDNTFDAAVCVHVLHLVDSRRGLRQLLQLVRPGGWIVLARDWIDPACFAGQLRNEFRKAVVELAESVDFPEGARGHVQQLLSLGEWQTELSPSQVLDGIRSRDDAESWVLPDALLQRVMQHLDRYSAEQWNDLTVKQPVTRRFVYSLFRVP